MDTNHDTDAKMRDHIIEAVRNTILIVGMDSFRQTSLFGSSEWHQGSRPRQERG